MAGAVAFLFSVLTGALYVSTIVITMTVSTFGAGVASPAAPLAGLGGNPALAAATVLTGAGIMAQISFAVALKIGSPGVR